MTTENKDTQTIPVENEDLLQKTSERMEKIGLMGFDEPDEVEDEVDATTPEDKPVEDKPAEDQPSEDTPSEDEPTNIDEEQEQSEEAEEKTPTLPDAYRRSAIHQGWTQDEIDEFFKSDPEKALKTLSKIHESNNRITTEFSNLGRMALEAQKNPPKPTTENDSDITKIIGNLEKEHGGDPLYEDVVKPLAQELQRIRTQVNTTPQSQTSPPVTNERDGLVQQINTFFGQETLKGYYDFYGVPGEVRNDSQVQNYNKVLNIADQLIAGSILKTEGKNPMSVPDALDNAHLLVSEPYRAEAERVTMKASMKKREKGVVLKPSTTSSAVDDATKDKSKPDTRAELLSKTRQRLKKVFGT